MLCTCLGNAKAAESSVPVTGETVELPKFVVEDTRLMPATERWEYVSLPGYEILSSTSASKARVFLRDFDRMQQVLGHIWPSLLRTPSGRPITILLCDKVDCFKEYLSPANQKDAAAYNQVFNQGPLGTALVVDFQKTTLVTSSEDPRLALINPAAESSSMTDEPRPGEIEADPFKATMDAYLRLLLKQGATPGGLSATPDWLVEGLVQIISAVDFSKKTIEIGRVGSETGPTPDDFNWVLSTRKLLPLETLFGPMPEDVAQATTWKAQSYAFVHLCLFGDKLKYRQAVAVFAEKLRREPLTEALFRQCFGEGYKEMGENLRAYAYVPRMKYNRYDPKDKPVYVERTIPALQEATASQVGRLRGEALCIVGDEARGMSFLLAPYIAGERDPELLGALGLAENRQVRIERARKLLEAAVKGHCKRAEVYLALAKLRLDAAMAGRAGQVLTRKELDLVLPLFKESVAEQPNYREQTEFIFGLWQSTKELPTRSDFDFLKLVAEPFAGRPSLVYQLASVAIAGGFMDEARELIARGEKLSRDPRGVELFRKLSEKLPPGKAPAP